MAKKIAIVGETKLPTRKKAPEITEVIQVIAPLPIFKDLKIGERFRWQQKEYKKVSGFAAYRNKVGLFSFGSKTPVEII